MKITTDNTQTPRGPVSEGSKFLTGRGSRVKGGVYLNLPNKQYPTAAQSTFLSVRILLGVYRDQ